MKTSTMVVAGTAAALGLYLLLKPKKAQAAAIVEPPRSSEPVGQQLTVRPSFDPANAETVMAVGMPGEVVSLSESVGQSIYVQSQKGWMMSPTSSDNSVVAPAMNTPMGPFDGVPFIVVGKGQARIEGITVGGGKFTANISAT